MYRSGQNSLASHHLNSGWSLGRDSSIIWLVICKYILYVQNLQWALPFKACRFTVISFGTTYLALSLLWHVVVGFLKSWWPGSTNHRQFLSWTIWTIDIKSQLHRIRLTFSFHTINRSTSHRDNDTRLFPYLLAPHPYPFRRWHVTIIFMYHFQGEMRGGGGLYIHSYPPHQPNSVLPHS